MPCGARLAGKQVFCPSCEPADQSVPESVAVAILDADQSDARSFINSVGRRDRVGRMSLSTRLQILTGRKWEHYNAISRGKSMIDKFMSGVLRASITTRLDANHDARIRIQIYDCANVDKLVYSVSGTRSEFNEQVEEILAGQAEPVVLKR